MGRAPIIMRQIFDVVKGLKALDVAVLLVEQSTCGGQKIADRAYVMETGRITMDGPAAAPVPDPRIRQAIWGYEHDSKHRP